MRVQIGAFCCAIKCPNSKVYARLCQLYNGFLSEKAADINIELEEVDRLNEELQSHERIRKFILSDEEWTVENRELTTSFKPMRSHLAEKHKVQIEKLYAQA